MSDWSSDVCSSDRIHDHLPVELRPSIVLMNPPFSASPGVAGRYRAATAKHLSAALARLADGGRLVAITGNGFAPNNPAWRARLLRWQERGDRKNVVAGKSVSVGVDPGGRCL